MVGTRPEAIKMAPVAHALAARGRVPKLVLTGQHPQLRAEDFGLGAFPAIQLSCRGEQDPHRHVRNVTAALLPLLSDAPDLLVVQGDTSSALGGALAGFTAGVPVAHVEAGLRTHDPLLPWPEEEYRTAIDAGAQLLFAPTDVSAANLRGEGLTGEIYVTGNTSIDALLAVEASLPPSMLRETAMPRLLVTCHRRESWGDGLQSIASALLDMAVHGDARIDFVLHPNPHVAQRMTEMLGETDAISLLNPCSHADLVRMIRDSDLVLSDSGGIQEEAPALGTPLLVLRDKTERPEAITSGNALLVGTSTPRILEHAKRLLSDPVERATMTRRALPFGDGRSGPRIAAIVDDWLVRRSNLHQQRRHGTANH